MITKEQIAEAAEQYAEQENSAWTNDYNGFEAGANFVMQLLQQNPCTALRESLDKMLSKELKLTGKYEWEEDEYKATERITALSTVIKMIDACQPVA